MLLFLACVPDLVPPPVVGNPRHDFDLDGYSEVEGDCDDAAPGLSPGEAEVCGDGLDNDCDADPGDCFFEPLTPVTEMQVHTFEGVQEKARFGAFLATGYDFSGDGLDDLAVSSPHGGQGGERSGHVFAFRGPFDAGKSTDASKTTMGGAGDSRLGALALMDDEDQDSRPELAMGMPGYEVSGATNCGVVLIHRGIFFDQVDDYTAFIGGNYDVNLGESLAYLGDVDGDGGGELVAGAPGFDSLSGDLEGGAFIHFSSLAEPVFLLARYDFSLAGSAVARAGDLDADGTTEVLIGAPGDSKGAEDAGAFYLVPSEDILVSGFMDVRIGSEEEGEALGSAVAGVGDLNGDGVPEVAVGAPGHDEGGLQDVGIVYIFDGATALDAKKAGEAWARVVGDQAGLGAGARLASSPDIDGDGAPDLLVGAPTADIGGLEDVGAVYLVSAPEAGTLSLEGLPSLVGVGSGDAFGSAIDATGDFDGDGNLELVIGAPGATVNGERPGAAYLVFGLGI